MEKLTNKDGRKKIKKNKNYIQISNKLRRKRETKKKGIK